MYNMIYKTSQINYYQKYTIIDELISFYFITIIVYKFFRSAE